MNNNETNVGAILVWVILALIIVAGAYYLFFSDAEPAANTGNPAGTVETGTGQTPNPYE